MELLLVPVLIVLLVPLVYYYGVDSRLDERGSITHRPS
jgi:hypothetical protein